MQTTFVFRALYIRGVSPMLAVAPVVVFVVVANTMYNTTCSKSCHLRTAGSFHGNCFLVMGL